MTATAHTTSTAPPPPRSWRAHAAALGLFIGLSVLHTWPLASAPGTLSRNDNADAILNEWITAWVAHQIPRAPLRLFDANIFYPEPNTLAFSEHMLVQSLMGAPLYWAGGHPVLVYNLLVLAGFVLSGWVTYLVMFRWTGDRAAALLAGALFAFNAHAFTRIPHLQALHLEFLPLTIAALDRLLAEPRRRHALVLAICFALQGLTSNYALVFTTFSVVGVVLARPGEWMGPRIRRLAGPAALAGAVAVAVILPFLLPYYWVHQDQGFTRTLEDVARHSGSWRDYLSTPGRWHFAWWSHRAWKAGGYTPLFPGVVATLLAAVALASGVAVRDRRARAWLAIGVVGFVVSFGVAVPGYGLLYRVFPLMQGIRAPVRMGQFVLAAVAVLAGFGLAAVRRRWTGRTWRTAGPAVLLVLAMLEVVVAPISYTVAQRPPPVYDLLARERRAIVAEFPMPPPGSPYRNARYMLNSTRHWRPLINGYSGFLPRSYGAHWRATRTFPAVEALRALADIGVTHVVVHGPTTRADTAAALQKLGSGDDTTVYRLRWDLIGR